MFPGLPQPMPAPVVPKPAPAAAMAPQCVAYIELEWDHSLQDMDLALEVIGPDGQSTLSINFKYKGELASAPFVRFDEDIRQGPGCERIDVRAWYFDRYELIATNYSGSGQMTPQALRCRIVTARETITLHCPAGLAASCHEWRIAELIVNGGVPDIRPFAAP